MWTCEEVEGTKWGTQTKTTEQEKRLSEPLDFPGALDEMLLQHGEFPAPPLLPAIFRYLMICFIDLSHYFLCPFCCIVLPSSSSCISLLSGYKILKFRAFLQSPFPCILFFLLFFLSLYQSGFWFLAFSFLSHSHLVSFRL